MQQPTNSTASFERVNCLDEHDFRKLLGFRSRSDCSDGDGLPVNRACAMVPEQKAPIAQPWAVSRTPRQTLQLRGSLAQSRYLQGAKPDSGGSGCFRTPSQEFFRGPRRTPRHDVARGTRPVSPVSVPCCDLTSQESGRECLQTVAGAPDEGLGCNAAPAQAQQSRVPLVIPCEMFLLDEAASASSRGRVLWMVSRM